MRYVLAFILLMYGLSAQAETFYPRCYWTGFSWECPVFVPGFRWERDHYYNRQPWNYPPHHRGWEHERHDHR